jgi:hypothetical protein
LPQPFQKKSNFEYKRELEHHVTVCNCDAHEAMKAENIQTDEKLALNARDGSEADFNELVDRYTGILTIGGDYQ